MHSQKRKEKDIIPAKFPLMTDFVQHATFLLAKHVSQLAAYNMPENDMNCLLDLFTLKFKSYQ